MKNHTLVFALVFTGIVSSCTTPQRPLDVSATTPRGVAQHDRLDLGRVEEVALKAATPDEGFDSAVRVALIYDAIVVDVLRQIDSVSGMDFALLPAKQRLTRQYITRDLRALVRNRTIAVRFPERELTPNDKEYWQHAAHVAAEAVRTHHTLAPARITVVGSCEFTGEGVVMRISAFLPWDAAASADAVTLARLRRTMPIAIERCATDALRDAGYDLSNVRIIGRLAE